MVEVFKILHLVVLIGLLVLICFAGQMVSYCMSRVDHPQLMFLWMQQVRLELIVIVILFKWEYNNRTKSRCVHW